MLKTKFIMSFKDSISKPLKGIKKQANQVRNRFVGLKRAMGNLARQTAVFGVGALGAAFGLHRMADSSARQGDQLAKTAKMLGLNVVELQQWQHAAERAGISKENLNTSIQRFTRRTDEARRGTGEALAALKYMDIQLTDSNGKMRSQTDLLDEIADKFKGLKGDSERLAITTKLFDTEGARMVNLLSEGSKGMQALRKEALELGVFTEQNAKASEEYADVMSNFDRVVLGLKASLAGSLLPELSRFIKLQTQLIKDNKQNYLKQITDGVTKFAKGLWSAGKSVVDVVEFLGGFKTILYILAALMVGKLIIAVAAVISSIMMLGGAIKALTIAIATNPLGLIFTAIALAAVAAVYLIYKYWEPISEFFSSLWKSISEPFKKGFVHGVVAILKNFNPVTLLSRGLNALVQYLTGFDLSTLGAKLIGSLRNGLMSFKPTAWMVKTLSEMMWALSNVNLLEVGTNIVSSLKDGLLNGFVFLRKKVTEAVNSIFSLIPDSMLALVGLDTSKPLSASVDVSQAVNSRSKTEVGGALTIQIDSEGRPRVRELSKSGGMDINVDVGRIMAGAL